MANSIVWSGKIIDVLELPTAKIAVHRFEPTKFLSLRNRGVDGQLYFRIGQIDPNVISRMFLHLEIGKNSNQRLSVELCDVAISRSFVVYIFDRVVDEFERILIQAGATVDSKILDFDEDFWRAEMRFSSVESN